ncbi:hypothetical protein F441_01457 [Phytophthora nicotianae CJ01A1]|uniref:Uncharacterized protein n=1 Tax=Phytophthora nicotianae CJ01A1 TaxID=1317063 RepID=W2XS32_PHYNI|nr:hypothetical protein F441_01457 [Phytophthora nicotianae CJ01A1]
MTYHRPQLVTGATSAKLSDDTSRPNSTATTRNPKGNSSLKPIVLDKVPPASHAPDTSSKYESTWARKFLVTPKTNPPTFVQGSQSPREGEYASPSIDLEAQDQAMPEHSTGSEQYQADQQAATGSRTPTDPPPATTTTGTDQILAQLIQMMATQQQTMMAGQQQMHEFMRHPAAYQTEMFA